MLNTQVIYSFGLRNIKNNYPLKSRIMKALIISEYNEPLKLAEIAKPVVGNKELLIQVKNTTVNHIDVVKASGAAKQIFPIELPWIPGHEFSGIIKEVGNDIESFKPGDPVFGNINHGGYAEYLVVTTDKMARLPQNLSFAEAASVPVAAQTAWQGIFEHGKLAAGQTILIHGGAGAVGAYALQFAHHIGAKTIVTAGERDRDFLATLGADQVIDYQSTRFENEIKEKVDVVFDLIGGDVQQRSYAVLRKGGHLIAANQPVSQEEASKFNVTALMMDMQPSSKRLGEIAKLLEEGKVKPDVAAIYSFEDAARAWKDIAGNLGAGKNSQSGKTPGSKHGKLVIQVS
jgi:NADPH:quinone reductase-like Zn-dependent oxidoreductase